MKRWLLATIASVVGLTAVSVVLAGGWVQRPNNEMSTDSTNVGIGTTNPAYPLDVIGSINLTGSLLQNGSAFSSSQWTTNGVNVGYTTGAVGIGTTAPAIEFQINDLTDPGIVLYDTDSGVTVRLQSFGAGVGFLGTTTSNRFSFGAGSVTEQVTVSTNGFLGINNTNPTDRLTVGGTMVVSGTAAVSGASFSVGGSTFVVTGGRVGIGYTNPSYGLHVATDTAIDGNLYVLNFFGVGIATQTYGFQVSNASSTYIWENVPNQGDGSGAFANTPLWTTSGGTVAWTQNGSTTTAVMILKNGKLGIGTTTPTATLHVKDATAHAVATGDNVGNVRISGAGDANYTLLQFMGDKTTPIGQIAAFQDAAAGGSLHFGVTNSYASGITATSLYLGPAGMVGVGTILPGLQLSVQGASAGFPAASGTTQVGDFRLQNGSDYNVLDFGNNASGVVSSWIQSTNRNDLSTTYPLMLNPNGGAVGIGTTAPVGKLHVVQSGFTTGALLGPGMFVKSTGANLAASDVNAAFYSFLVETGTVSTGGDVGHNLGGVMRASDSVNSNTYAIGGEGRVDAYGFGQAYVGLLGMALGTYPTSSTATLVGLYGRAQMTSNGVTANSTGTAYGLYVENTVGGAANQNYGMAVVGTDDINWIGGNLGIGSFGSQPADLLSITRVSTGAMTLTTTLPTMQFKVFNNGVSSTTTLGTTTGHRLGFMTTSSERVSISTNGTVGIGTTNPSQKLDVQGNITSTGTIFSTGGGVDATGTTVNFASATVNGIAWTFPITQGAASTVLQNNGSGALSWATGAGDNLGNHTATTTLDMANFAITNAGNITSSGTITSSGAGFASSGSGPGTFTSNTSSAVIATSGNTAAFAVFTSSAVIASTQAATTKMWEYVTIPYPGFIFNSATVTINTSSGAYLYGEHGFKNNISSQTNCSAYVMTVPEDIDTAGILSIARYKFTLGGADTGTHRYVAAYYQTADSAVPPATLGVGTGGVNLDFAGDASGASGDIETVSNAATAWAASLTAGAHLIIEVCRDGDAATVDTSTVDSTSGPLVLKIPVTKQLR